MLETNRRNGLEAGLVGDGDVSRRRAYKNLTSEPLVDIDAAPKAGHCVEPESDIQSCATTTGAAARREKRAALILNPMFRWDVGFLGPVREAVLETIADSGLLFIVETRPL